MVSKSKPLVIVPSGRHGSKSERRAKLMFLPAELYDEIAARSEGPLNQVLVELIQKGWSEVKRSGRPLTVTDPVN